MEGWTAFSILLRNPKRGNREGGGVVELRGIEPLTS
jgi:hypothetical protein